MIDCLVLIAVRPASQANVDFLAVMSHELRTPLNAVLGFTTLASEPESGSVTDRQKTYLRRAHEAGQRLLGMIDEILLFTNGEGELSQLFEPSDLVSILHELVDEMAPIARVKGVDLWFDPAVESEMVVGNRARVRRIIGHVLANALKFTRTGQVRLELRSDDSHVHLDVIDTGIGIPDEALGRIFEPFSQVDQTRRRRAEGAGIGLAVARRTARLLGGDVEVSHTSERGSTFRVSFLRHRELVRDVVPAIATPASHTKLPQRPG